MSLALLAVLAALRVTVGDAVPAQERAMTPVSTFPERVIAKGDSPHEWPFSIDEGRLSCIPFETQRHVFFSEILTDEEMGEFGNMTLPRMVVVTANPMAFLATVDDRELYAPWDTLETLIKRLAPYERMGWELCDGAAAPRNSNDL